MTRTAQLTLEQAKAELSYDPGTGLFVRISKGPGKKMRGRVIGTVNKQGYLVARINFTQHKLHRVAWLMAYGEYPAADIDHVNRNKADNRIANLRLASPKQNAENRGLLGHGASGVRGVCWHARTKSWRASIGSAGTRYELGLYETKEEAQVAYLRAAKRLFTHMPEVKK